MIVYSLIYSTKRVICQAAVSLVSFDAWNELWVGALSIHDRRAAARRAAAGGNSAAIAWRIERGRPA